MKEKNFRVKLLTPNFPSDISPSIIICPGQEISGFVHVVAKKEFHHEGIYVIFKGKAKIRMDMGKRTYLATEKYSKLSTQLMAPSTIITLGDHPFPFKLKVPADLPNSFKWKKCGIFYELVALMKRPYKNNLKVTVPLYLSTLSGLPPMTVTPDPLRSFQKFKKTTGPLLICCADMGTEGPVGFKVTLPKIVFVPGEDITLSADLINHSSSKVKSTIVSLVQKATFYCREYELPYEKKLTELKGPELSPEEVKTWVAKFKIPTGSNVVPSGLPHCKIIDVDYFLYVEMTLWNQTLQQQIPILIHRSIGDYTVQTTSQNSCSELTQGQGHVNDAFVF